ncbi:isopeptide-forming domain-containing fimbrial protein [Canibacter sp. lx-45]|uniref:SpaH/EbpB family LPXTG-anchored major pilin n=1 Tax=Canibacter zhuwentaonis TaxID=2837491 RepID=UPI001BDCE339|nr:SpaH/EbpB family LPXTG-anchored major pilin [Canibacter zhuwentaonis]MBT1035598.1 isopeptide-forming domain-containing fimbrial protein [Canibacter zhuwentaonis]
MNLKKFAAIVALPALVAGGLILTQPANAAAPGDIDKNRQGSIVIHKHQQDGTAGAAGTGKPVTTPLASRAIEGVTFSVQKINVDLTTSAGWQNIGALTATAAAGMLTGNATNETTDANGDATFSNLEVGAYLVTETQAPAGVIKASPFIVTVPHPNGNGDWNYEVHVYPKNSVTEKPTKQLDSTTATKVGDKVKWTVTQKLPDLKAGAMFNEVSFRDNLVTNLKYVDNSMVVKAGPEDALMAVNFTVAIAGQEVSAEVEDPSTLMSGQIVTFEFETTIEAAGEIKNVASVTVRATDGSGTTDQTPPMDDPAAPVLIIGHLDVHNLVEGTADAISGGVFEVYSGNTCEAGNKIDGLGNLTAGDNGKLAKPVALKAGDYSVKQVTAPVGYTLNTECIPVSITTANPENNPVLATVYNSKATVPVLPLTGAQSQVILLVAGGALVVAGLVAVVAVRRKRALVASK